MHWGLALALVAILALTAFNVSRVLALSQQQSVLATAAERDEAQAHALVSDAASVRAGIDQKALEHVVKAAEEANDIIDQRTFSWTELLNHIERTLPNSVMLTAIAPKVEKGQMMVTLVVLGRSVETVDDFIDKMEATKAFSDMSPISERITENGLFEVTIAGAYHPGISSTAPEPEKKDPEKKDQDEEGAGAGKPTPAPPKSSTPPSAAKRGMAS